MIKIISGKCKNTKLEVPIRGVRPTSGLKKEAIFSILESYALKNSHNIYNNKQIMDLFAGTGSLGLEAISRGASHCYFYENDPITINILKKNCDKICKTNNYEILNENVINSYFKANILPTSLIFIDPPYNINPFKIILNNLIKSMILDEQTKIIIETHKEKNIEIPIRYKIFNERVFGKTKIIFLTLNEIN